MFHLFVLISALNQEHTARAEEKFDKAQGKGESKKSDKVCSLHPIHQVHIIMFCDAQRREKLILYEKQAMTARNEYLLSLGACNAFKERYYQAEVSALIDAMDQSFFDSFRVAFQQYYDKAAATGSPAELLSPSLIFVWLQPMLSRSVMVLCWKTSRLCRPQQKRFIFWNFSRNFRCPPISSGKVLF